MKARAAAGLLALAAAAWAAGTDDVLRALAKAEARGDRRAVRAASESLLERELSREQIDRAAARGLSDLWSWNTELPDWQRRLLERWVRAWGLSDQPEARFFEPPRPAAVLYHTAPAAHARLYLEGGWSERGEPADLRGWRATPMTQVRPGVWRGEALLRRGWLSDRFPAILRTAPWPAGRAVASGTLSPEESETELEDAVAPPAPAPAFAPGIRTEVAVLGLDGATWRLVVPWVRLGYLPNFARLLREGACGVLVSGAGGGEYPSSPNEQSAMTGKLPDRHGMRNGFAGGNFDANLARKAAPLWSIAAKAGLRAGVVGAGGTFPPDDAGRGVVVSDAFCALQARRSLDLAGVTKDAGVMGFARAFGVGPWTLRRVFWLIDAAGRWGATTWPASLSGELSAALPAKAGPPEPGLEALAALLDDAAVGAARLILDDPKAPPFDLFLLYSIATDAASHADAGGPSTLAAYRRADRLLGWLMARGRHVVVWSDHGAGAGTQGYGRHMANGLLAVWGPAAAEGARLPESSIVDVAPTVLALLGLPAGADMDGRVVAEAFSPAYLAAHPPSTVPSHGTGGSGWARLWRAFRPWSKS
jgi:hypothetical protein